MVLNKINSCYEIQARPSGTVEPAIDGHSLNQWSSRSRLMQTFCVINNNGRKGQVPLYMLQFEALLN